jgi:hypothetical protein
LLCPAWSAHLVSRTPCWIPSLVTEVAMERAPSGATQTDGCHLFEYVAPDLDKSVGWLEPMLG